MIKGYQGDELWTAVNPATGKHEVVEPEGEFIPGETIIKLCYWKGIDGYVRIPGDSLFKVVAVTRARTCRLMLFQTNVQKQRERYAWSPPRDGVNPTVALHCLQLLIASASCSESTGSWTERSRISGNRYHILDAQSRYAL